MTVFRTGFRKDRLWQGCILASIAHSIFIATNVELANEQSWDGRNYNIQDTMGSVGTVTFTNDDVIGAFFDPHSPNNASSSSRNYDFRTFLSQMPDGLRQIAVEDTLQYLLQDYHGSIVPMLTTTFWSDGGVLVSAEPWDRVLENGAHLIQVQLSETDVAVQQWAAHYGLSDPQQALLRSLAARKVSAPDTPIRLTDDEKSAFLRQDSPGAEASKQLLGEIGIAG